MSESFVSARARKSVADVTRRRGRILMAGGLQAPEPALAKSDTRATVETWRYNAAMKLCHWSILYILYMLMYGVALVVGAAGIVGLANAPAASVLERKREIGILRAMGAS